MRVHKKKPCFLGSPASHPRHPTPLPTKITLNGSACMGHVPFRVFGIILSVGNSINLFLGRACIIPHPPWTQRSTPLAYCTRWRIARGRRIALARNTHVLLVPVVSPKPSLKGGKVVVLLAGRYAGKKAIVVKTYDADSTDSERKFGHCLGELFSSPVFSLSSTWGEGSFRARVCCAECGLGSAGGFIAHGDSGACCRVEHLETHRHTHTPVPI